MDTIDVKFGVQKKFDFHCGRRKYIGAITISFTAIDTKIPNIIRSPEYFMDEELNASWGSLSRDESEDFRYLTIELTANTPEEISALVNQSSQDLIDQLREIYTANLAAVKACPPDNYVECVWS